MFEFMYNADMYVSTEPVFSTAWLPRTSQISIAL